MAGEMQEPGDVAILNACSEQDFLASDESQLKPNAYVSTRALCSYMEEHGLM